MGRMNIPGEMRDWGNQLINLAFLKGRRDASYQRWTADYQTSVVAETARQTQRDRLAAMQEQSELAVGREAAKGKAFAAGTSVAAQQDRAKIELAETKLATDTVRYTAMAKARGLEGSYSSAQDVQMGMLMRKTDNAALASQRLERAKELTIERYPDDASQIEFFDTLSDYDQFYKEKEDQKSAAEAKAKATEIDVEAAAYTRAGKIAAEQTEQREFEAERRAHQFWESDKLAQGIPWKKWWAENRADPSYAVRPVTVEDVLKGQQRQAAPAPTTVPATRADLEAARNALGPDATRDTVEAWLAQRGLSL